MSPKLGKARIGCALCVFNYTLSCSYKIINCCACIHTSATYSGARARACAHTHTCSHTPLSKAGSSTVPTTTRLGNVELFKYESEKNIERIAVFNFQTFVIVGLLVPVGHDQNKD